MTTYGVTLTGFIKKTLSVITAEIGDDQRDTIKSTLNLLASALFGQMNGIFGDKLRELWDVAEAVYRSAYPSSASGDALDQVASITGAVRLPATKSEVTLDKLLIYDGTTVPVGSIVSVDENGNRFVLTEAVVNSLGYPDIFSALAESEEYGPINGLAKSITAIQTPVVGWVAAASCKATNPENYTLDGKALTIKTYGGVEQTVNFSGGDPWTALTAGAEIESQVPEMTYFDAGSYLGLTTNVSSSASRFEITGGTANAEFGFPTDEQKGFNTTDADVGRNVETDPDFRLRRLELLQRTGAATVDAIRARVRELADVVQAFVLENVDIVTSPEGLPPKSFEAIVLGGDDQEIADTIWDVKPAGIETYGSTSKTVEDSAGFSHTIEFSRPTEIPIYMEFTVLTDPVLFPTDGVDQIKVAMKLFGDAIQVGEDVIALQFKCVPLDIAGVIDVTIFLIDDVDPPVSSANIVIDYREIATFDTGDMDVTVTP